MTTLDEIIGSYLSDVHTVELLKLDVEGQALGSPVNTSTPNLFIVMNTTSINPASKALPYKTTVEHYIQSR